MTDCLFVLFCAGIAIAGFALVIYWPLHALGVLDAVDATGLTDPENVWPQGCSTTNQKQ